MRSFVPHSPTSSSRSYQNVCPFSFSSSSTPWCPKSSRPASSMIIRRSPRMAPGWPRRRTRGRMRTAAPAKPARPSTASQAMPWPHVLETAPTSGASCEYRGRGTQRLDVLAHVVRSQDGRAPFVCGDGHADRRRGRADAGVGITQQLAERALAREADQDRAADRDELVQPTHELEVVFRCLPEADARVEADELLADSLRDREREPLLEERLHLRDDVVVARVGLHRPRLAL